ncbi:MAG: hypothetical protein HYY37_06810 [Candidatus Aenigmarchaeota archaeon]|nr:hypothetical protein [Candidatus Aenigmarchaeota archaeon]
MAFGSYLRFFTGILLAGELIRLWLAKEPASTIGMILAVLYLLLSVLWFAFKF